MSVASVVEQQQQLLPRSALGAVSYRARGSNLLVSANIVNLRRHLQRRDTGEFFYSVMDFIRSVDDEFGPAAAVMVAAAAAQEDAVVPCCPSSPLPKSQLLPSRRSSSSSSSRRRSRVEREQKDGGVIVLHCGTQIEDSNVWI